MNKRDNIIQKTRDFYSMKKDAKIIQSEFGYYSLNRWIDEGHIKSVEDINKICGIEGSAMNYMSGLGWCEAEFCPYFDVKVIEDRGDYELEQDHAGRHVLYFKGRRNGFMPEYVAHPVVDQKSWERDVKWRMDPKAPSRFDYLQKTVENMKALAANGEMIGQSIIGGYMYLRSLVGPEGILYLVYDEPELVHDMMRSWFELADEVTARHQEHVSFDEVFFAEDICYNHGLLISPDMVREFLFPYYQQLISNIKKRQLDKSRHMYIQIDTDGDCRPSIPVYKEIGMDYLSPFEVASGCDVVELRKEYPDLLFRGGIDKRVLAEGKEAIDRMIDRIMPFMVKHGGYIPTCDHGVPEEVDFESFVHYRKRLNEF